MRIAVVLGESNGRPEMNEALFTAPEIREVDSEHRERDELGRTCPDLTRERECLLRDNARLVVAPGEHQPIPERREHLRALWRGRVRRQELDSAPGCGEAGLAVATRGQVRAEALVRVRSAERIVLADERDGSACKLDGAWCRTGCACKLGRPGAELGEVEPSEARRIRHRVPERERPLDVGEGLREAEDRLGLTGSFDRSGERLCGKPGGSPVWGELRRGGSGAGKLAGEPCVQLLALAGQDRRVDRLRQERVAEAKAARRLLGDEHAVLDGHAQRLAHLALRQIRRHHGEAGSRRRVRRLRPDAVGPASVDRGAPPAGQQHVAKAAGECGAVVAGGIEKLLGVERIALGAGDDRVRQNRW